MASCPYCGNKLGNDYFCRSCGAARPVEDNEVSAQPTPIEALKQPASEPVREKLPDSSGMMAFSIINTVMGGLFCCCYGAGLVSLILGIIAISTVSKTKYEQTAVGARRRLATAKTLNIIALVFLFLGLIYALLMGGARVLTEATLSDY